MKGHVSIRAHERQLTWSRGREAFGEMITQMRSGKDANEVTALQDVSGSPRNYGRAVKRTAVCAGMFTSDPCSSPSLPPNTDKTSGKGKKNHSIILLSSCASALQTICLENRDTYTHPPQRSIPICEPQRRRKKKHQSVLKDYVVQYNAQAYNSPSKTLSNWEGL